ncbi:hypothetical protein OH76DRAFT_525441 [Lentinus brumalis]|uniref:Uncharacterized protein n=1 Tax=Lentinus brumalis TaxID=2498619 RepID=A0A371CHN7_9APHY|nr:hypothetical protein OH76DRAFT_525441 [Polyporus brumalis]
MRLEGERCTRSNASRCSSCKCAGAEAQLGVRDVRDGPQEAPARAASQSTARSREKARKSETEADRCSESARRAHAGLSLPDASIADSKPQDEPRVQMQPASVDVASLLECSHRPPARLLRGDAQGIRSGGGQESRQRPCCARGLVRRRPRKDGGEGD